MGLLAQYGKDFKRIAASMPNKARLSNLCSLILPYLISPQTTIQVGNFYTANLERYNLSPIAAQAPGRSPTPQEAKKDLLEQLDNATGASHERSFAICDVPPISATSRSHLMDLQSYPFTIPPSSSTSTLHLYS